MESLEELARKKFADLSAAEERVVRAAPNGIVADCGDLGGGDDPGKADGTGEAPDETWPKTRNVRADLIRWVCVAREAREQVDPHGIWISGARITGRLDLSFASVLFPLLLMRCRLDQDLNLRYAKIPLLSLAGSWTETIGADGLELEGDILLRNGFQAEGEVRLLGAAIGGAVNATGGTFKNTNGNALNVDRIKVMGDIFLRDGFVAEGAVRLPGATIGGNLDGGGGTFKNPNGGALIADGSQIRGDVFMSQELNAEGKVLNEFLAEGEVRLLGATIGGNLGADGGTFKNPNGNALNADGINVTGNVFLRQGLVAVGQVWLRGAEVNGQLVVESAWLDALNLDSAQIAGPFFWQGIHKDGKDRHPDFPNKQWNPSLNLTNAKVGSLVDDLDEDKNDTWLGKGQLRLDGFVYDRIAAGPTDARTRIKWLRLQPDWLGFRPQPYEQLIAVLRQMGHEHQVAKVAIAEQWDMRKKGHLGLSGWIKNWSLYLAVGYGHRAWLAFIWLFLLIVLGGHVFARAHSANVLVPSDQAAYTAYEKPKKRELPPVYPRFHALLYSLDVVSPFDLGQKSKWRLVESNSYWKFELYSLLQLIAGWALLLVAAAVPAGFIKKD